MTRLVRFSNNAVSRLAANITNASTTISLTPGDGAKFPVISGTQFFMATLIKSDGTTEIVKVTARSSDTLTVVRAAEPVGATQTAYAFTAGDRIEQRLTAKALSDELDRLDSGANIGAANKTANYTVVAADVSTLIRVDTTSGAITITLPEIATLADDFDIMVAKVTDNANAVSIVRAGATDLINGAASYAINNQWQSAWLIADRSTNTWTAINSGASTTLPVVDSFTGNGTAGPYTLSGDPGIKNNTVVYVSGVYQQKSTYTLTGTSLTLGGTVPVGTPFEVVWSQPVAIGRTDAALVSYDGQTVQDVLDGAKQLQDYTALRAYTGRASRIYITGLLATAKPAGIAGVFQYDPTDTTSADNGGTIIVGADGRRWKRDFDGAVNLRWFGANFVGGADTTSAFNAAISATEEGGTLEAHGTFYVAGLVNINKNINLDFSGKILLAADNAAYISFSQDFSLAVSGNTLSALPKKGDSQLLWSSAPALDNPSNYFFSLISSEEEITRIGQPYYTPYTKNESNAVITDTYFLRSAINLTYTDASKLTAYFYRKRTPVTVKGLNISVVPQAGVSSKSEVVKLSGISNITFENVVVDRLNTNWIGNNFSFVNSYGLQFKNCQIKGVNNNTGDSYAFVCSISSFLRFDNCEYVDGNGFTKRERGYAARHGNHISFYNCRFAGIDDHYGHNYFIEDCVFNLRGVSVSGGSVTIKDSKILGSTYLYSQRPDAPYSDGTLHIENCEADSRLVESTRDVDARSTKRKFYDHVRIVNCKINNSTFVDAAIKISKFIATDTLFKTSKLEVINTTHIRGINSSYCSLYEGSTAASVDGGTLYRWVESADFINCDMSLKNYIAGDFSTTYIPVRSLNADAARFINNRGLITYGCSIGKTKFISCELSYGSYNFEMYLPPDCGEITFDNCDIGALINPDATSTTMRFVLKNNLLTYKYLLATGGAASRLASRITYMSRNRSLPDADLSGAPSNIEYYINPTYYKTA